MGFMFYKIINKLKLCSKRSEMPTQDLLMGAHMGTVFEIEESYLAVVTFDGLR